MKKAPEVCGVRVPHGALEPVVNGADEVIGQQCRRCLRLAQNLTACESCKSVRMCKVRKSSGARFIWFCDEDCAKNHAAVKAKEKADREAAAAAKKAVRA